MKQCPFCAEDIQDDAVKCRYCNEFLDGSRPAPVKWYFSPALFIIALLTVGPLALPLLWFNPKIHWITKTILTVAVVGLTLWLYFVMQQLYRQLDRQLNMLHF